VLEDRDADGRDVSWIWDADFEVLAGDHVTVSGRRGTDMAVRLKYAGVPPARLRVQTDLSTALDTAVATVPLGGDLFILATYTGMLNMRQVWVQRGYVRPYWEDSP